MSLKSSPRKENKTMKNQNKKPIYTVRLGVSYGWQDLGEYPSKAAAKRALEQYRVAYPVACLRVAALED